MAKTYAEQLDEIETAITAITTRGQSYQVDSLQQSRQLTRADLRWLLPERRRLQKLVDRETRGGIKTQYVVPTN